ncbi:MAG: hypothetical protein WKG03_03655 [Telluria sp.]
MGLGPIKNGVQQVTTPRDGKAWCDVVNSKPLPEQPPRCVLALGSCNADGSGFKSYEKPVERTVAAGPSGCYLWLGDFRV